jgi:ParB family chromosome partitioning protein
VSTKNKGLGRNFDTLIPTDLLDDSFDPTASQDQQVSELRNIPIAKIKADPNQPRRHFDQEELDNLSLSIKQHGVLQPIIVMPAKDGYMIVAGERRFRASQLAGLDMMPALVRTMSDQHGLEVSLIENLQRQDLNIIETATAYLKLKDQFNLTLDEIGKRVGSRSVSSISNILRLLKLPNRVRIALAEGKLTEGQARPLVGQDEKIIQKVLPKIVEEQWSARKIEQFIVDLKNDKKPATKTTEKPDTYKQQAEKIKTRLNTDVNIRTSAKGSGSISIKFKDDQDLDRIFKTLGL